MKKIWKRVLISVGTVVLAVLVLVAALFWYEMRTLSTLRQADQYPLYTMRYAGDYGFDDFLKVGATSDKDIERFVMKRLLKGVEIDLGIAGAGCSAFTAVSQAGDGLFARNFDFDYAPPLLLWTKPDKGYVSVSLVNLAFAGYGKDNLPKPFTLSSFLTLAAPYLPFDGMNEKGVAMALLAVPTAQPPQVPGRVTLNTTATIRLVLDKAATVDEALALLKNYNLYFSGGVECHYLLADRSGRAVVVEYVDGKMQVTEKTGDSQIVTNFIVCNGQGEGGTEFQRYDTIKAGLAQCGSVLNEADAMKLLSRAAMPGRCQWSVVYNLNQLTADVCVGEKYGAVYHYTMK